MKRFFFLLILSVLSLTVSGQKKDSSLFHRGTFLFGAGLGTKSHVGNWGLTTNLFLAERFNLKFSGGMGQINYNGFLVSIGPEYFTQIKKNKFVLIGSVWTITSDSYDVIDDESPTRRSYKTYSNQYIRTYAGIAFEKKATLFKIEIGYSYALHPPKYRLDGAWSASQTEHVKKAMSSGLSISLTIQGILSKKQQ